MCGPEDYQMGFVCKACGSWFAFKSVKDWDTNWCEQYEDRWPTEGTQKCPLCGEVRSYLPNECVLRGMWLGKP